jgi:DNA-binding LacI/PurR family transcriptional regulator
VRQNFAEIGRRAVSLLLADLQGSESLHDGEAVQPDLIVRRSTAKV